MTKYLKEYIKYINEKMNRCTSFNETEEILQEHKDKISFMQHERLVHFIVTMMFALILVMLIIAYLIVENIMLGVLIIIITSLLGAYIKHYYFLENTVQNMYLIYDRILRKRSEIIEKSNSVINKNGGVL